MDINAVEIIGRLSTGSIIGIIGFMFGANLMPGIPEDVGVLIMGYVVGRGSVSFFVATVVIVGTLFVSDNLTYFFSRHGSKFFTKIKDKIFGTSLDTTSTGIKKNLPLIIIISRFLFQIRFIGPFLAGVNKMPWYRFAVYDIFALCLYVPTLLLVGIYFEDRIIRIIEGINVVGNFTSSGLFILLFIGIFLVLRKAFKYWLKKRSEMDDSGIGISPIHKEGKK